MIIYRDDGKNGGKSEKKKRDKVTLEHMQLISVLQLYFQWVSSY